MDSHSSVAAVHAEGHAWRKGHREREVVSRRGGRLEMPKRGSG